MSARTVVAWCCLSLFALSSASFAQEEDDLLAPLTPGQKTHKKKKREPKETPREQPSKNEDVVPLTPLVGPTQIKVELVNPVKNAHLFIDGGRDIPLPMEAPVKVSPGTHTLVVKRLGFRDFTQTLSVKEGTSPQVPVNLEAVAGVLAVNADIPGSEILLDGTPIGMDMVKDLVVASGTHDVTVRKHGYQSDVSRLVIRPGRDVVLNAHLKPLAVAVASDRPTNVAITPTGAGNDATSTTTVSSTATPASGGLLSQWWFWAGTAVVVAAATATTVAVMNNQPKPLSASQVCGGPCDGTINAPALRFGGARY